MIGHPEAAQLEDRGHLLERERPATDDVLREGDAVTTELVQRDRPVQLNERLEVDDADLSARLDVEPSVELRQVSDAQQPSVAPEQLRRVADLVLAWVDRVPPDGAELLGTVASFTRWKKMPPSRAP
jgi:hypothetical protein